MERARTDLDVDRLLDDAAAARPVLLEREDEILQVHAAARTLPSGAHPVKPRQGAKYPGILDVLDGGRLAWGMVRGIVLTALATTALAFGGGCSLLLDFSDKAIPKDATIDAPDAPYSADECAYKEPNDTVATAAPVVVTDVGPAAICAPVAGGVEDHDFYRLTVPVGTTSVRIAINFIESPSGDLDLRLYDSGANVIAQSRGFTGSETITCPGSSPPCAGLMAGDYVFEVFPAVAGAVNSYNIALAITP